MCYESVTSVEDGIKLMGQGGCLWESDIRPRPEAEIGVDQALLGKAVQVRLAWGWPRDRYTLRAREIYVVRM